MATRRRNLRRGFGPALVLAALLGALAPAARAQGLSAAEAAGRWDLSWEKGNRRCRLTLRAEGTPAGQLVAMPAGCRHAFPALAMVAGWAPGENDHILFQNASGSTVIDFGPGGGPSLSATVGEENVYDLLPVDPALQAALAGRASRAAELPVDPYAAAPAPAGGGVLVGSHGRAAAPAPSAAGAAPSLPPVTVAEVAGHYAVLRQDRDTGCMVTLEAAANARAEQRARLAPSCRDQGIVIFDPAGWQLSRGELVLVAKRGHRTVLTRQSERSWATAPAKGVPLVLKRL